jgi:hypothetical protein
MIMFQNDKNSLSYKSIPTYKAVMFCPKGRGISDIPPRSDIYNNIAERIITDETSRMPISGRVCLSLRYERLKE